MSGARGLRFYLRQAVVQSRRNAQRTLFVLFCIAVGVAAVVSLRTVSLMIGAGLQEDLQSANRGDLVLTVPFVDDELGIGRDVDDGLVEHGGDLTGTFFSELGVERLRELAAAEGGEVVLAIRELKPAHAYRADARDADPVTVVTYFVEPRRYPLYGAAEIEEPAGVSLAEALASVDAVAVSRRLADALEVGVGDAVHLRGPRPFTVTAILSDASEARLWEMEAVVLPYLVLPYAAGETVFSARADTAFIALPEGADPEAAGARFAEAIPGVRIQTTADLEEQNRELAGNLTRLATTLGLVSLLIGGIGIVNTMLVVVGRRTLEIGVLKTLGLQGRQITAMFLVEAALLGVVGSVAGLALGVGMMVALRRFAERVLVQSIAFRLEPEAMLLGLATGVLVTLVFGFLPTLAAGRVRPAVVLQPDRSGLPAVGSWTSLLVIASLTGIVGLWVGRILGSAGAGLGLAYATVAALGLLTWLFRLVVVLLGRLPTFGRARLKLVQRGMSDHPGRTASTLLALTVGMFGLSAVLLMTGSLLNLIRDVLEEKLGGDVIVVPESPAASDAVARALEEMTTVRSIAHQTVWRAELVAIDGDRDLAPWKERAFAAATRAAEEAAGGAAAARQAIEEEAASAGDPERAEAERSERRRRRIDHWFERFTLTTRAEAGDGLVIGEGRDLREPGRGEGDGDAGAELVLRRGATGERLGLAVGSRLTLRFSGDREIEAEVVGLIAEVDDGFEVNVGEETTGVVAAGRVPDGVVPEPTPFIVDVEDDAVGAAVRELSALPGVFALPVSLINQLLTRLFEKLAALPLVVSILALFAAGVIAATTVSLSVLDRRRQIGILKAIGLASRDVLAMLLMESALIGLAGGLLGAGAGAVMIVLLGVLAASPGSFPFATLAGLVALATAIGVGAALVTAWGASRDEPLAVLRTQ